MFTRKQEGFECLEDSGPVSDPHERDAGPSIDTIPPTYFRRHRSDSIASDNKSNRSNRSNPEGKDLEMGRLKASNPHTPVKELLSRLINTDNMSVDSDEGHDMVFIDVIKTNLGANIAEKIVELGNRLLGPLRLRLFYFSIVLVILALVIFGQGQNGLQLNGVPPRHWYAFCLVVMGTDIATCVFDESIFMILDTFWNGPDEIRLYAHCLNGPLGFIITVSVMNGTLSTYDVVKSISNWNPMMSTLITIWTFYTLRRFYQRMNYNNMMVNRFSDRLEAMEMESKILSILACHGPNRRCSQLSSTTDITHSNAVSCNSTDSTDGTGTGVVGEVAPPSSSVAAAISALSGERISPSPTDDAENTAKSKAMRALRKSVLSQKLKETVEKKRAAAVNVKDIFAEIVASSASETTEAEIVEFKKKKTFWTRVHDVSHGHLKVRTFNGRLIIRSKKHALSFGERLFTFLSKNQRKKLTGKFLCSIIENDCGPEDDKEAFVKHACTLFHVDNTVDTAVSKDTLNSVCISVYYSHKNAAKSLSDFGELQKSLMAVTDVVFWIIMVIIAQMILKIDTDALFAPVLTLVFAVSFAVGPTIGNACMAVAFVSFMLPYDVGDRIAVGAGATKIIGNVTRITLLQTTVLTIYNEQLHWPNHVLFGEKIMNLTHSLNATLEIPISFALDGPTAVTQEQLDCFWSEIRDYINIQEKDNWKECFIAGHTIDAGHNNLGYTLWATHRTHFSNTMVLYTSRTQLIEKLLRTQREVGIRYMNVTQPVDLMDGRTNGASIFSSSAPPSIGASK